MGIDRISYWSIQEQIEFSLDGLFWKLLQLHTKHRSTLWQLMEISRYT